MPVLLREGGGASRTPSNGVFISGFDARTQLFSASATEVANIQKALLNDGPLRPVRGVVKAGVAHADSFLSSCRVRVGTRDVSDQSYTPTATTMTR